MSCSRCHNLASYAVPALSADSGDTSGAAASDTGGQGTQLDAKAMMQQAERGELEIDELQALARKLRAIQQVRAARAQLEGDWVEPKPSKQ